MPNEIVDSNATLPAPGRSWREAPGPWATLPPFPSRAVLLETHARMSRAKRAARRRASLDADSVVQAAMPAAYSWASNWGHNRDAQSTNIIGRRVWKGRFGPGGVVVSEL